MTCSVPPFTWRMSPWTGSRKPWGFHLYPSLEQDNVYKNFNFSLSGIVWYNNANSLPASAPTSIIVNTWHCPSGSDLKRLPAVSWGTFTTSNYLALFPGDNVAASKAPTATNKTAMGVNFGARFADITDGTSNTMAG